MQIIHTIADMRRACARLRDPLAAPSAAPMSHAFGGTARVPLLGLVPTMGALHQGHLSLVRAARQACRTVAVSIFVNPLQFAPNEDLAQYPRPFNADCALLQYEGVDLVFAPSAEEMYPPGSTHTFVEVPEISDRLDGASRPQHFRGVTTVVAKLFSIVQPQIAFFGQKDAAQLAVLRAMVRDLNLPVELRVCRIVRDSDGLALSSRNRYLTGDDRQAALVLSRALKRVEEAIALGQHDRESLVTILRETLTAEPALRLDYADVVDPDTLLPIASAHPRALIAVAGWVGQTRLIDNLLIDATAGVRA